MAATEDRYDLAFDYEVDQVGKPANDRPSDVAMNRRLEPRVTNDPTKEPVNGRDEVAAKTSLVRFVPRGENSPRFAETSADLRPRASRVGLSLEIGEAPIEFGAVRLWNRQHTDVDVFRNAVPKRPG